MKSEQIKLVNSKQFHVVKILNCLLKSKTESKLSALLFSCSVIRADRKNMQILIRKKKSWFITSEQQKRVSFKRLTESGRATTVYILIIQNSFKPDAE